MGYSLNFTIPQGPTGPTGPVNIMAYGGIYDDTAEEITDLGDLTQVPMTNTMPTLNLTYADNSINISESGIYEINYHCNLSSNTTSIVTLTLRNNQTTIPESTIIRRIDDNYDYIFSGNIILNLEANSKIDMALSTSNSPDITFADGTNSYIIIKKINS